MKTNEGCRRRGLGVARETSTGVAKVAAREDVDVHQLAKNLREGTTRFILEGDKLGCSSWEHLREITFEFVVSAEGCVDALETLTESRREELLNDSTTDVLSLIEGDAIIRLDDPQVEIHEGGALLGGDIKVLLEVFAERVVDLDVRVCTQEVIS